MPCYRQTLYCGQPIEPLGLDFIVPIGSKMVSGHLSRSTMPGGKVPVYLVHQDQYFDRDQLYAPMARIISIMPNVSFFFPRRPGGHPPARPAR